VNGATRLALAACLLSWCAWQAGAEEPPPLEPGATEPNEPLVITDLTVGIGNEALPGMVCIVHYTGWLFDEKAKGQRGRQFDSSRERRQPFAFPLGGGHVIRGWDRGVVGMRVGGLRRLIIPPSLGYGNRNMGNGTIPPGSTLVFEIELLAVETVTSAPQAP
jgi:FKBP-type peptidyl-prolyl cis-trans isomerase